MILTVKERLLLLQLLDGGSAAALHLRLQVAFKPEEVQKVGLTKEGDTWKWNTEIASEIEFHPSVRQQLWLSDKLELVSAAGKLIPEMVGLFDRFVLARE